MRATRLALLLFLSAAACRAGDPPPPDLKQPVDYFSWFNSEYGKGKISEAAPLYENALAALVPPDEDATKAMSTRTGPEWTKPDKRAIADWVGRNEKALDFFAQASKVATGFLPWKSPSGTMVDMELPALSKLRQLCRAAAARARLRLIDGATTEAIDDLLTVLRVGRHLQDQPVTIAYLVGLAGAQEAHQVLRELPELVSEPPDYADVLKKIAAVDRPPPTTRKLLITERAYLGDFLQRRGKDADGDGRIESVQAFDGKEVPFEPPVSLVDIMRIDANSSAAMLQMENERYPAARKIAEVADAQPAKIKGLSAVLNAVGMLDQVRRQREANLNGARAVLRLHAAKKVDGKWPATLKEAMAGETPTMRWDPFSDGELIYKLENGEPKLYSVGRNGKDDGGTKGEDDKPETGDIVFWPISK